MPYERDIVKVITSRINEQRKFLQIVMGPRQTGKTTAISQAIRKLTFPCRSVETTYKESDADWLRAQWQLAHVFSIARHSSR